MLAFEIGSVFSVGFYQISKIISSKEEQFEAPVKKERPEKKVW